MAVGRRQSHSVTDAIAGTPVVAIYPRSRSTIPRSAPGTSDSLFDKSPGPKRPDSSAPPRQSITHKPTLATDGHAHAVDME